MDIPKIHLPGDNQQQDTTDTNNSTNGKTIAEDIVEGKLNTNRLGVEGDDPAMSPNTVTWMAANDVDDGFLNNLPGDNQQQDTTDTNNSTNGKTIAEDIVEGKLNTNRLGVEGDDPAMSPNTVTWMAANDVDDGFLKNLPGDNQQQDTTDTNNSTNGKTIAEDIVEGKLNTNRLGVEGDDPAMSPNTVTWMAANDVDDGFLKNLACGLKSKLSDEDKEAYGFKPESGNSEHVTAEPGTKGPPVTRAYSFEEAMRNRMKPTGNINASAATASHRTETELKHAGSSIEQKGIYVKKTPPPRPAKTYTTQKNIGNHPRLSYEKRIALQSFVHPDVYDFTHPQRGYMVLIVNDMFLRQNKRDGSEWDVLKAKEISRKLGFRILNRNKERNLRKSEMIRVLREAQAMDHSDSDCFALVISTHGTEDPNPRAGGKFDHALICSDDEMIFTSTILDMFNDRQCPTLKDKPKLFFIQACRGDQLDDGADVAVAYPRKAVDKTCGVAIGGSDGKRRGPPTQESVDELDTIPWSDPEARLHAAPGAAPKCNFNFQTRTTTGIQVSASSETNIPYIDDIPNAKGHNSSTSATIEQNPSSHSQSRFIFVPKDPVLPIQPRTKYTASASRFVSSYNVQKPPIQHAPSETVHKLYAPQPYPTVDTPSLKCDNDFLVLYAIPPGMFAWRNTSEGSWMIDYLHRVIMAYNMARRPTNLLSLLTRVSAMMSQRETNTPLSPEMHMKKAVSVIEHKLTKDVIFTPKAVMSEWVR